MVGKISCFEIIDLHTNPYIAIVGSGRLRRAGGMNKEIFSKIPSSDIGYELEYGVLVPRRLQARDWNGSFTESVFM